MTDYERMDFSEALKNCSTNHEAKCYPIILNEILESFRWGVKDDKVIVEGLHGRTLLTAERPDGLDFVMVKYDFLSYSVCPDIMDQYGNRYIDRGIVYKGVLLLQDVRKVKDYLLSHKILMDEFDDIYGGLPVEIPSEDLPV